MDITSILGDFTGVMYQFLTLILLMMGIILGELITFKVFGRPKPPAIIIDIILFILIISVAMNFIQFEEYGTIYYLANFLIGLITIIIVRAIETPFGLTEKPIAGDKTVVNLIRVLAHYGLDKSEIKNVLNVSGFHPSFLSKYKNILDTSVPIYLPKIIKMQKDITEIKNKTKRGPVIKTSGSIPFSRILRAEMSDYKNSLKAVEKSLNKLERSNLSLKDDLKRKIEKIKSNISTVKTIKIKPIKMSNPVKGEIKIKKVVKPKRKKIIKKKVKKRRLKKKSKPKRIVKKKRVKKSKIKIKKKKPRVLKKRRIKKRVKMKKLRKKIKPKVLKRKVKRSKILKNKVSKKKTIKKGKVKKIRKKKIRITPKKKKIKKVKKRPIKKRKIIKRKKSRKR